MQWVEQQSSIDIRNQLSTRSLHHSMDFFNKMRAGVLMSRITKRLPRHAGSVDHVSSDLFKQPVAIVGRSHRAAGDGL